MCSATVLLHVENNVIVLLQSLETSSLLSSRAMLLFKD